ncbi:pacearchaeosortase [Candidatus Pacearchaeota archaeon]|nr:pacearchaeosortase [Candidatus Pacearchaeota archaeon]
MKKISKQFLDISLRYAILILLALPGFAIFYFVFAPLTIYPIYFLLGLFFDVSLMGDIIFINEIPIELIGACIAGSAYYLLSILNLSTPKIKLQKRIKILLLSFGVFLILNILRIFFLSLVFMSGSALFDITHKLFWYIGSILFVVGIWFAEVKLFKIKEIPFYSDIKFLYKQSKK